jgi:hypothetical protein
MNVVLWTMYPRCPCAFILSVDLTRGFPRGTVYEGLRLFAVRMSASECQWR